MARKARSPTYKKRVKLSDGRRGGLEQGEQKGREGLLKEETVHRYLES